MSEIDPDEAVCAASDMIDAWCAANPAPASWPDLGRWYRPDAKPVKVTYARSLTPEEFFATLTGEQQQAVYAAATQAADVSCGDRDEIFRTLLSVMANYGKRDVR